MICPVCKPRRDLVLSRLEEALQARHCSSCGGNWVRLSDYWKWRALHGPALPVKPADPSAVVAVRDAPGLKFCPDCRYVLARYRVGHDVPFTLEQCRNCQGIWMDAEEWEVLKSRHLHDELHEIFSEEWQKEIKQTEEQERTGQQFLRQFGAEDLARVREIKQWLDSHPKRSELYAYLQVHETVRPGAA